MISVHAAKQEGRLRDKHRGRLVLSIGKKTFHITRQEARTLRGQLSRFNLNSQKKGN